MQYFNYGRFSLRTLLSTSGCCADSGYSETQNRSFFASVIAETIKMSIGSGVDKCGRWGCLAVVYNYKVRILTLFYHVSEAVETDIDIIITASVLVSFI